MEKEIAGQGGDGRTAVHDGQSEPFRGDVSTNAWSRLHVGIHERTFLTKEKACDRAWRSCLALTRKAIVADFTGSALGLARAGGGDGGGRCG